MRPTRIAAVLAALSLAGAARAQRPAPRGQSIRLYPSPAADSASAGSLSLVVPPSGIVPLTLVPPAGTRAPIDLSLSAFSDPRGDLADVRIALADSPSGSGVARRRGVRLDSATVGLRLEIAPLSGAEAYSGHLFLSRGGSLLQDWRISLRRATLVTPAKLVLDRQAVSLDYTRRALFAEGGGGPRFTVRAREESGDRPLEGVVVRLLESQGPNSPFDPEHVRIALNGDTSVAAWTLPPGNAREASARTIPPGGQMLIEGRLLDFPVGEHHARLRITAANSQEDPRQELALTLRVRDAMWIAVLVLILATAFSFVSTKYLSTRRQRLAFERRLADQSPSWLRDEPSALSVVWVRAILKQAQDLTQRRLLAGTAVLDARLAQSSEILKRLERLRDLRRSIEHWQQDPLIARRALKILRSIEVRLGAGPIDAKLADTVDRELAELDAWRAPGQLEERYWAHLKGDIDALLASVNPVEAASQRVRSLVETLVGTLGGPEPTDLSGKLEFERAYCKLKLLWERNGKAGLENELAELVGLCEGGAPLERLFDAADGAAWKRLSNAVSAGQVRFVSPRLSAPDPPEAYQPLLFEIAPDAAELAENYLFKHKVRYDWELTVEPKRRKAGAEGGESGKAITLLESTRQPRVIQYAPRPGTLTAKVTLRYRAESCSVSGSPVPIGASSDFAWMRAFGSVEVWAVALAGVAGVVTGLFVWYAGNATFGSMKDYISVFLWGAGVDQTKNFLQILQGYSGSQGPQTQGT
jgi:hypothetical protein